MCGVAATYAYSGTAPAVDREELRAVRDHMAARGPDGFGEWFSIDGRVGLGHRRLSIIDLSERGAQPMANADGQVIISFNGEIYNYRELRSQLQALGRAFRTDSDTEVLLQLYEEFGTDMLAKLRGMFAFALWDGKRRALLLARDAFGIKPLYYADDGKTLRAASQVKALLRAPVDTSPEPAGHAGFFLWGSVPGPWTLYRGIRSLPAGHFMWIGQTGADAPESYCLITDLLRHAAAQPARGSAEDALRAISAALEESVTAHLVSDVPVGVFLSAGLDSAMIAALAARSGASLRTLTLGFAEYAGSEHDEVPWAEAIARKLGTAHSTHRVRKEDFQDERRKLLAAMDQPSIDGVNTWFVARASASQGIKVALSGIGGDELFASYPSFRDVPRTTRWAAPLSAVPGLGLMCRKLSAPFLQAVTSPKYAGLLEYGGTTGGAYLLRRGLYMPWELPRVMDPDMARDGWRDLQALARLDAPSLAVPGRPGNRLAVSALEMSWYLRHQILADADWAGMAHSVEIRVPLLDLPLLTTIAPWLATHPRLGKRQVAAQAAPALPEAILNKPKTGFSIPVRDWLGPAPRIERGLRGWARTVHARQTNVPRVLVSTLAPGNGGVAAMTSFVVRNLQALGLEPVIGHYAPYSVQPALSVPTHRLLQRGVGTLRGLAYRGCESHAIGAWLPELEFTHYAATPHWRRLMDSCDAFVAVSGNVLAATPFCQTGRNYLAWVATDWHGDRKDRIKMFPRARRWLDAGINTPIIRRIEKKLLTSGRILPLSGSTARTLAEIAGTPAAPVILPIAVDHQQFTPNGTALVAGRLGFAGRFNDPRKNIGLLLDALQLLRARGHDVHAVLIGDTPSPAVRRKVEDLGLGPHVRFMPSLTRTELRDCMQTLDIFVLPSHQEGLCISALEAMSCGVPVVSTRCGGPEEFVIPGVTGQLADASAGNMAVAIASLLADRPLRSRMSLAARELVETRYTRQQADATFVQAFRATFPALAQPSATPSFAAPSHAAG